MADEVQTVNPYVAFAVKAFDYQRLLDQFGLEEIDAALIERFERITGTKAHPLLKRKVFFAHRDLEKALDHFESGKQVYLYTGRGPSSESLHLGHLLPMIFTAYLQRAFKAILVVEMSDIEKVFFKKDLSFEEARRLAYENAKDMIACGFDKERTFFFTNSEYIAPLMPIVFKMWKKMSLHVSKKIYGFEDDVCVGCHAFPAFEQAPAVKDAFPHLFKPEDDVMCMVVCAVDQYPFFRSVRDFIESLGGKKPIVVASKFLPGLQGAGGKMSASTVEGEAPPSIFLDDTAEEVARKIKSFAFSGGRDTLKEHRELGGDLSVDIPYIYLLHFLEDEERFKQIGEDYSSGKMLSGEIKQILIDELVKMTKDHQEKRAAISPEELKEFFAIRPLKGGRTDL